MTITRADVADLREGDIVEVHDDQWSGVVTRGPLHMERDMLCLGAIFIRKGDEVASTSRGRTLTVISRAPRPLYVNHPRAEPVEGDIVRDCDGDAWRYERREWWCASVDACDADGYPIEAYRPLTLLWDGETGQVVP